MWKLPLLQRHLCCWNLTRWTSIMPYSGFNHQGHLKLGFVYLFKKSLVLLKFREPQIVPDLSHGSPIRHGSVGALTNGKSWTMTVCILRTGELVVPHIYAHIKVVQVNFSLPDSNMYFINFPDFSC